VNPANMNTPAREIITSNENKMSYGAMFPSLPASRTADKPKNCLIRAAGEFALGCS